MYEYTTANSQACPRGHWLAERDRATDGPPPHPTPSPPHPPTPRLDHPDPMLTPDGQLGHGPLSVCESAMSTSSSSSSGSWPSSSM